MRFRLVIIRVSLWALRYTSANSAVLLISSSLSSIGLIASFSADTYYKKKKTLLGIKINVFAKQTFFIILFMRELTINNEKCCKEIWNVDHLNAF